MRLAKRLDSDGLWQYALRALAARAQASGELRVKLRRRAERAADVDAVLARLKEYGYLNDRAFAEAYAAARLTNQRLGKARVISDLRQKRVAPSVAERTVDQVYADVDEEKLIEEFLRRKNKMTPREHLFQEAKELAAAYRRLRRAGFGSGNILKVLKKFARNPELLDGFESPAEEEVEE
jgi:regulatory protein